jgi:predicted nucleotidyltransferase component of viral defense system
VITKQHILERAAEWRLRPDVVEKDYVLGWLLAGVAQHAELRETWIFKGGTCLKKCYFETYRFSEDLDFSLTASALYSAEDLLRQLKELARRVNEVSGIELPESAIVVETKKNKQGQPTFRARIGYRGPLAVPTLPRVLLDITQNEVIAAAPTSRSIFHPYPDDLPEDALVSAYSLEELFAEKTRALHERTRPRDLYDVVQLVENYSDAVDFASARAIFRTKCTAKGIATPSGEALVAQVRGSTELEADWKTMLAHQLPALPPLEGIRSRMAASLAWVDEPVPFVPAAPSAPVAPPPGPARFSSIPSRTPLASVSASSEQEIVAPAGGTFWGSAGPLELVRFAGSNRLMITFTYHGKHRTAEPYSLRRAGTGNLLLYAWEEEDGHVKAFKVPEISRLAVTETTFVPRYLIELNAIGSTIRSATRRSATSSRRAPTGLTYVIQCPYCHKTFRRNKNDSALRAHKRPDGIVECPGRVGYLVRTE